MITSIFKNLKNPFIVQNNTIDNVIEMIRGGYTKKLVQLARLFGKGTEEYEDIKEQIPTFTPNASFSVKRCMKDLQSLSGFIYLDFDSEVDQDILEGSSFIYAYWKSVSNIGYGALAKVNGLSKDNFNSTWNSINSYFNQFGICLDSHCKDITRQNVITYDPDIYVNKNCCPFEAIDVPENNPIIYQSSLSGTSIYDFTDVCYSIDPSELYQNRLVYKTTLDCYNDLDYVVIKEGKEVRNCFLPKEIKMGERHKWIAGYILSILFNNKNITKEQLLKVILKRNLKHCKPALLHNEVNSLVEWYYNLHINGSLNYNARLQKIFFNPEIKLSLCERRAIIGKESGKLRREKTISVLKSIYEELKLSNQRVTQKMIEKHELCPCKLRTIKKYWSQISD